MEVPTTAHTCMCTRTHKHTCKHKHTHTCHSTKTTCYFSKGVAFQSSCIREVGPSFRDFPDSWSISWPQHYQGLGDFWIHVIDHMVLFFIHLRQSRWVDTSFVIFWKKFGGPGLDIREIHLDLKGSLGSEWCHLGAGYWPSLRHTSSFLKWGWHERSAIPGGAKGKQVRQQTDKAGRNFPPAPKNCRETAVGEALAGGWYRCDRYNRGWEYSQDHANRTQYGVPSPRPSSCPACL